LRVEDISPELALVDPELAAQARTSLPEPAPFAPAERSEPPERPEAERRGRSRRRKVVVAVVAILVLGAAAAAVIQWERNDAGPPAQAGVLGATKTLAAPPKALPTPPGQAPRVYVWAPAEGAAFYHVTFVRNGRTFHSEDTPTPWLKLSAGLRFPPGTYRWSVQPAIAGDAGIALEDAVLVRTFRVTRG
jgi:hypothetical protein